MANKATFTSTVNAFISIVVTIVKVRNALLEYTNELWKSSVNDTDATTNVITKTYASADYNLDFNKVGNKVYVNGIIKVFGSSTLPTLSTYATFTTAEFKPKDNKIFYINGSQLGTSTCIVMQFIGGTTTGTIKNGRPMLIATDYTINGFYETND
jgi:hypothetical protein